MFEMMPSEGSDVTRVKEKGGGKEINVRKEEKLQRIRI
jgi:hypothetical protein